jgi:hypothetical protein
MGAERTRAEWHLDDSDDRLRYGPDVRVRGFQGRWASPRAVSAPKPLDASAHGRRTCVAPFDGCGDGHEAQWTNYLKSREG